MLTSRQWNASLVIIFDESDFCQLVMMNRNYVFGLWYFKGKITNSETHRNFWVQDLDEATEEGADDETEEEASHSDAVLHSRDKSIDGYNLSFYLKTV